MDDEIRIVTSEELRNEDEANKTEDRKKKYIEACMLMMQGIDKLAAAGGKLDPGSPELSKLIDARIMLSEPLARAQAECGFQEWMYRDWKREQENIQEQVSRGRDG